VVGRLFRIAAVLSCSGLAFVGIRRFLEHASLYHRTHLRGLAQHRPPPRVVIFHGLQDGMIPSDMGRELAAEFPAFVTFRGIAEANHDTVVLAAEDEILGLLADDTGERLAR